MESHANPLMPKQQLMRWLPVAALMLAPPLAARPAAVPAQPVLGARSATILTIAGLRFRDLDRNGVLDRYEDWRLAPNLRARDLVRRMTNEELAGTMMHGTLPGIGSPFGFSSQGYDFAALAPLIEAGHVTTYITRISANPSKLADQNNQVQERAEVSRLGVPVMISTDPRNHFHFVAGASNSANGFSLWPEPLGFGALRDPALVRRFASIAAREYRLTGIHMALSPQADLFTEPRWSRGTGTFGSDPATVRQLAGAWVAGFQGSSKGLAPGGVIAIAKHWVGYGAAPQGWDAHNRYGREAFVGNRAFAAHLAAFGDVLRYRVGGVMPTYAILRGPSVGGRPLPRVGAGFSRPLLTNLLRGRYRFDGLILTDWNITRDCNADCREPTAPQGVDALAMPWGVEDLPMAERFARAIDAGVDQFGGVTETSVLSGLIASGRLTRSRLEQSALRILLPRFRMGLFENPYVDAERADRDVGSPATAGLAEAAQARAQVLVRNRAALPLLPGTRVWLDGIERQAAVAGGLQVVELPEQAQFALIRGRTPFEVLHPNHFFGSRQAEGRLDFRPGEATYEKVRSLSAKTRVVLAIFADRPPVLGQVNRMASAILLNFGVSDAALIASLTGRTPPAGRLPFELPSGMDAVVNQDPALADDSRKPLHPRGWGLLLPVARR